MLQYTSAMITDYSSIYFDYLLLDKPIIFFPFDKEDYLNNQRDIVYNFWFVIKNIEDTLKV